MRRMEDNSVDAVVTDPPYGWNFMNKTFDKDVPSEDIRKEVLRVLKPGAHLLAACGTRTYHRTVTRIEDAGFNIRDCIVWAYGCLSEDTEILTSVGWKNYKDLLLSDNILQWNKEDNSLSWSNPKHIFVYDIDDSMVLLENRTTSQLLTQNHTVYAKIRKNFRNSKPTAFSSVKAGSIKKKWQLDLPVAGLLETGIDVKYSYLIGWWLADAQKRCNGKTVMFSHRKKEMIIKLRDALDAVGARYSVYINIAKKKGHRDKYTFHVAGDVANYFLENQSKRDLDFDILLWNKNSRYQLLEGLFDGGHSKSYGHSEVLRSKNLFKLDVVQALCVSLNIRSYIDYKKSCLYLSRKHNTSQIQHKHKRPNQQYVGKVWCIETEVGAFVVRRNGKPFITGNSGFPKSLDISKALDRELGCEREIVGQ